MPQDDVRKCGIGMIKKRLVVGFLAGLTILGCGLGSARAESPGEKLWVFSPDAVVDVPAIGPDGTIYVTTAKLVGGDEVLSALTPSGVEKWKVADASKPSVSPDGTLYVKHRGFSALNPDGTVKWSFKQGGSKAAVALDGTVYFGTASGVGFPGRLNDDMFYALNPDGSLKWELHVGLGIPLQPAVGQDGTVYFVTQQAFNTGNKLYAVTPEGAVKWTFALPGEYGSAPAVGSDGTVYFGYSKSLYAVSTAGQLQWQVDVGLASDSSPAIGIDGTIYIGASSGRFLAVNPDGSLKWATELGGPVRSALAIDRTGGVYFASNNQLHALTADGLRRWVIDIGSWVGPILSKDGILYFGARGAEKGLWSVQAEAGLADSPWPMSGHDSMHTARASGKEALRFAVRPRNQEVNEGASATLSVVVEATIPLEFQWQFNGQDIAGATGPDYRIGFVRPAHAGEYQVWVRTSRGDTVSGKGVLRVIRGVTFVDRELPAGYFLGANLRVLLKSDPFSGTLVYAVQDDPPDGWTVVSISHGGEYDVETGKVKFGPFHDDARREMTYELKPPAGGAAIVNRFEGTASSNGVATDIIGDTVINLDAVFHPADQDPSDNALSIDEVTAFGWAWKAGASWAVPPTRIESDDVQGAAEIWQGGERYVYDATAGDGTQRWAVPGDVVPAGKALDFENETFSRLASVRLVGEEGRKPGEILWQVDLFDSSRMPTVGLDGTLYFGFSDSDLNNQFRAFNPDGSQKWQAGLPIEFSGLQVYPILSAPMMGPDGTVYLLRDHPGGSLLALTPEGGKKWETATSVSSMYPPALGPDGTIYVGGQSLYAVTPQGGLKWQVETGRSDGASVGADGTVYAYAGASWDPSSKKQLFAVNPDGTVKWTYSAEPDSAGPPVIGADEKIYLAAGRTLHAVGVDGISRWKFTAVSSLSSQPAIGGDGTLYVGDWAGNFYAIDPAGIEKWRFQAETPVVSTPALAMDGSIYFGTRTKYYAMNFDGSIRWTLNGGGSWIHSPAITPDGIIYMTAMDQSKLFAVYAGSPLADSPWPMGGHDPQHSSRAGGRTTIRITRHPQGQSLPAGGAWTFSALAEGLGNLAYQWSKNGIAIPGATNETFHLPVVKVTDAGGYRVIVSNSFGSSVSATGILKVTASLPFVEREFPSQFHAGATSEVLLLSRPLPGTKAYAVEDTPPGGWSVTATGEDGVYDTRTRKVKFGPFHDDQPRVLRYQLALPERGEASVNRFIGIASADGVRGVVQGDEAIDRESVLHPADVNPPDSMITIDEAGEYATAWKVGRTWPVAPNPVSIHYVTRAARIWKGGERYIYDPEPEDEVLRWTNAQLRFADATEVRSFSMTSNERGAFLTSGTARRLLTVSEDRETLSVSIEANPKADVAAYAVQDRPPKLSKVTAVSDGGSMDAVHGMVKWGPFHDNQARILTYTSTSSGAAEAIGFSGEASFDGAGAPVTGDGSSHEGPLLDGIGFNNSNGFQFTFEAERGFRYHVEVSTDLKTWSELRVVENETGTVTIHDPAGAGRSCQFYRIRF